MATKDISDLDVCKAYHMARAMRICGDDIYPYDLLEKLNRQPHKVCYAAMQRAYKRGLIEYGVSLRTGWLTEKGLKFLEANFKNNGAMAE